MRKALYISGSRADYGPARRVLQAIQADPELALNVLVTGMHLDPVHGETWQEIAADGFTIVERVYGHVTGDSLIAMAASVGLYLYGMSQAIARIQPDIVLVLGDRGEQLAGAIAAAFQNIVLVHLCGGAFRARLMILFGTPLPSSLTIIYPPLKNTLTASSRWERIQQRCVSSVCLVAISGRT